MPLDTGVLGGDVFASANIDAGRAAPPRPLSVREGAHIGEVLLSARNCLGLDIHQVSERTAIKPDYLAAIETMSLDRLPSRPFVIGFIRAYAEAVGVEPNLAVGRFKSDNPQRSQALKSPLGIEVKPDGRARIVIGVGVIVSVAILAWNVMQHAMGAAAPPSPTVADSVATRAPAAAISSQNPVSLSAPTAPPPEATTPQPYETPGMDKILAAAAGQPAAATPTPPAQGAARPAITPATPSKAPEMFKPLGHVYGAPANASLVTVQARKSGLVVVHGAGGAVLFAQSVRAGEGFRAPNNPALTLDLSDPSAFDVYVGGRLRAPLTAQVTPLGKIDAPAAAAASSSPH